MTTHRGSSLAGGSRYGPQLDARHCRHRQPTPVDAASPGDAGDALDQDQSDAP